MARIRDECVDSEGTSMLGGLQGLKAWRRHVRVVTLAKISLNLEAPEEDGIHIAYARGRHVNFSETLQHAREDVFLEINIQISYSIPNHPFLSRVPGA